MSLLYWVLIAAATGAAAPSDALVLGFVTGNVPQTNIAGAAVSRDPFGGSAVEIEM